MLVANCKNSLKGWLFQRMQMKLLIHILEQCLKPSVVRFVLVCQCNLDCHRSQLLLDSIVVQPHRIINQQGFSRHCSCYHGCLIFAAIRFHQSAGASQTKATASNAWKLLVSGAMISIIHIIKYRSDLQSMNYYVLYTEIIRMIYMYDKHDVYVYIRM